MIPALLLVALLPGLGPETSSALARGIAVAAAEDARFDVVSAFDLRELIDAPQGCEDDGTAAAEVCVNRLATAYEARLVFFLRVYEVSGETHAALTLNDVHGGGVLARSQLVGDDKELFQAVQARAKEALAAFAGHRDGVRTRVFVSEPAVQSRALQRSELEARVGQANDEVLVQSLWTGAAMALTLAPFVPAFGGYYAGRLGVIDDRIGAGGLLAAVLVAPAVAYFVAVPAEAALRDVTNRRDGLSFELGALDAVEE